MPLFKNELEAFNYLTDNSPYQAQALAGWQAINNSADPIGTLLPLLNEQERLQGLGIETPIMDTMFDPNNQGLTNQLNQQSLNGAGSLDLGFNMPTLGLAIQGLSALGNLYQGLQANKLAKKQFNFQKEFANTNLNNQMQSYNTALTDRAYARASMDSNFNPEKYIEENKLTR